MLHLHGIKQQIFGDVNANTVAIFCLQLKKERFQIRFYKF